MRIYKTGVSDEILVGQRIEGLTIKDCSEMVFRKCTFVGIPSPVQIRGTCNNILFDHCNFYRCGGHNIQTAADGEYKSLVVMNCGFFPLDLPWDGTSPGNGASGDVIALRKTTGAWIDGCTITNSGENGITISRGCKNVFMNDNHISRTDGPGIQLGSVDEPVMNIVVRKNRIQDWGTNRQGNVVNQPGIRCHLANNVSIQDNALLNSYSWENYGITARDTDTLVIRKNTIFGASIPFRIPRILWDTVTNLTTDIEPRSTINDD